MEKQCYGRIAIESRDGVDRIDWCGSNKSGRLLYRIDNICCSIQFFFFRNAVTLSVLQ